MLKSLISFVLAHFGLGQSALAAPAGNVQTLPFGNGGLTSLAWSADGKYLAACALSGPCRIWDATSGKTLATTPTMAPLEQQTDIGAFSADDHNFLMPARGGIMVWPWLDASSPHFVAFPPAFSQMRDGLDSIHSCGPNLIEMTGDPTHDWALFIDQRTFQVEKSVPLPPFSLGASCVPHAPELVVLNANQGLASLLNNQTGQIVRPLNPDFHLDPPYPGFYLISAAISPDGTKAALGGEVGDMVSLPDGRIVHVTAPTPVRLVSLSSGQDLGGIFATAHSDTAFTLTFSYDGNFLCGALGQQVWVQQLNLPFQAQALTAISNAFVPVAFSPVANEIAIGRNDRVAILKTSDIFK